jgi:hypothetical protein
VLFDVILIDCSNLIFTVPPASTYTHPYQNSISNFVLPAFINNGASECGTMTYVLTNDVGAALNPYLVVYPSTASPLDF